MTKSTLDYANFYLSQNFSVIPVKSRNKIPGIPSWKPYQQVKPTEQEINKWFGNGNDYNIGIVSGNISGLCVVDLDSIQANEFAKNVPEGTEVVVSFTYSFGGGSNNFYGYASGTALIPKK